MSVKMSDYSVQSSLEGFSLAYQIVSFPHFLFYSIYVTVHSHNNRGKEKPTTKSIETGFNI